MRFFVLILSLVILLQPASWAMGTPKSAHQQIDGGIQMVHSRAQLMALTAVEVHIQANDPEPASTGAMGDSSNLQGNHSSAAGCHTDCSSSVSLTVVVAVSFSPHYLDVGYHAAPISFQSRTESPEIRPPLNIRLKG